MIAVETQDKAIKKFLKDRAVKFFKAQPRNSLAVSHKTNGNPHIKLSAKAVTLLAAYMPNKEHSFGFN